MGTRSRHPIARAAALAAAGVQLLAVVALIVAGTLSDGPIIDRLRPVPIAVVYALPAILAVVALRGRAPAMLAAGLAALTLALFPFSLHSFVLGPIGLIYLVVYARLSGNRTGGARPAVTAMACVVLNLAAFLVLVLHEDPVCYSRHASGEVTVDRDPEDISGGRIGAGSGVVERGCTSDTIVWWEAAASLTMAGGAVAAALSLDPTEERSGPRATRQDE